MTVYTYEDLTQFKLVALKELAAGLTVEGNKSKKESWIQAILANQKQPEMTQPEEVAQRPTGAVMVFLILFAMVYTLLLLIGLSFQAIAVGIQLIGWAGTRFARFAHKTSPRPVTRNRIDYFPFPI